MKDFGPSKYQQLINGSPPDNFRLKDHLGGFDMFGFNKLLTELNAKARHQNKIYNITYHQILPPDLLKQYPHLKIKFSPEFQQEMNLLYFKNYNIHPDLTFKNFVCSFNGTPHVSRKLLVSIIKKFGWWNDTYCSKNFTCSRENIVGHLTEYVCEKEQFYSKFFEVSHEFTDRVCSFGHKRFDHTQNIYTLEAKLTDSFLHLNSETIATNYQAFITEKFTYSIVTRGLFLSYAQPGWHDHLEKYYGFKKYTKLFDYRFDIIQNPVERLVELMTMISKFSVLSTDDWKDLYSLQRDEIEFNYNHYFSGDYLKVLRQYA